MNTTTSHWSEATKAPSTYAKLLRFYASIGIGFLLSACYTLESHQPGAGFTSLGVGTEKQLGLQYFLPRASLEIEGNYYEIKNGENKGTGAWQYLIKVTKINRADPTTPVFARITSNAMFDEDTTLKVKDGLLTNAVSNPKDQTGAIIISLAESAIYAAKIAANVGGAGGIKALGGEGALPPPLRVLPFKVRFDPLIQSEYIKAEEEMRNSGFDLEIEGRKLVNGKPEYYNMPRLNNAPNAGMLAKGGLLYRRPLALQLRIDHLAKKGYSFVTHDGTAAKGLSDVRQSFTVPNPDPAAVAALPMRRALLTQRKTDATFVEGEPTEIKMSQGSPVLAFVAIPNAILKSLAEAVPSIINVRQTGPVNATKAQADLLEQQARLLKKEAELRQVQQEQAPQP